MSLTLTAALFFRGGLCARSMKALAGGIAFWAEDLRCDKEIAQCLDKGIIGLPSLVHCQGG